MYTVLAIDTRDNADHRAIFNRYKLPLFENKLDALKVLWDRSIDDAKSCIEGPSSLENINFCGEEYEPEEFVEMTFDPEDPPESIIFTCEYGFFGYVLGEFA